MRLLIFLAIFGVVAAGSNVYQHRLLRLQSRKTTMMKDGTWDAYYKDKQLLQQSFNMTPFKNLNDFDEVEYVGVVDIGSPMQFFNVHFDLTAIDFWIPDITCGTIESPTPYCPSFCSELVGSHFCNPKCRGGVDPGTSKQICDKKRKFSSTESTTFKPLNDSRDINREYEFGYISTAFVGQDRVRLRNYEDPSDYLTVPSATFSQTKDFSLVFLDTSFHSIVGLAHNGLYLSALENAKQLDEKVFTVYLKETEYNVDGGNITFGGLDEDHCSTEVAYQDVTTNYDFQAGNITYGSIVVQDIATVTVDTSRTSIYGPPESIQKIKEAAGVNEDRKIECEANIEDFSFGTTNGKIFTIPGKKLIMHNFDGSCSLAVDSLPPLQAPDNNKWIFGTPWFKSYCNVFSFETQRAKLGLVDVSPKTISPKDISPNDISPKDVSPKKSFPRKKRFPEMKKVNIQGRFR